jgi:hypothetical protein
MLSSWSQTASASQGRKGADPNYSSSILSGYSNPYTGIPLTVSDTPTSSSSAEAVKATAVGDTSGAQTQAAPVKQNGHHHGTQLTPSAVHGLIALGVIGI